METNNMLFARGHMKDNGRSDTFVKNALTRIKLLPLKCGTDRRVVYGNIFKDDYDYFGDSDDSDGIYHI
jgi:hypothetical protein